MEMKPATKRSSATRAARLFAVAAAVLALGSCQVLEFIFGSVFPSTVGLAKAQADLSGSIAANDAFSFHLRVVQSGGNGYVILIGSTASGGTTAFVYDLDLSLKATFTGLASDGVMVDGGGYLVISSQEYDSTLALVGTTNGNVLGSNGVTGGVDGFYDAPGGAQSANLGISGGTSVLNYDIYAFPWPASGTFTTSPALSTVHSSLRIDAVLDDGNPSGNITLAASDANNNNGGKGATCWFLTTPKGTYTAGGGALAGLLDVSPHLDNIDTESIGFAQGSIMAFDTSASRFLRIDPATGSTRSSFYVGGDLSSTRFGYLVSGAWFFGFDTNTRVLTKYAAWW